MSNTNTATRAQGARVAIKVKVEQVGNTSYGNPKLAVIVEPYMKLPPSVMTRILELVKAVCPKAQAWTQNHLGHSRPFYSSIQASELEAIYKEEGKGKWMTAEAWKEAHGTKRTQARRQAVADIKTLGGQDYAEFQAFLEWRKMQGK